MLLWWLPKGLSTIMAEIEFQIHQTRKGKHLQWHQVNRQDFKRDHDGLSHVHNWNGISMKDLGKRVAFGPLINLVFGDAVGNNGFCGNYNNHSNMCQICYDCKSKVNNLILAACNLNMS